MKCGSPLCMLLQVLADVHCCMAARKYDNYGYSGLPVDATIILSLEVGMSEVYNHSTNS